MGADDTPPATDTAVLKAADPVESAGPGPWRAPVAWEPADAHVGRAAHLHAAARRVRTGAGAAAALAALEVAAPSAQQVRDRPGAVVLAPMCTCGWIGPMVALPDPPRPPRAPRPGKGSSKRDRRRHGRDNGHGGPGGAQPMTTQPGEGELVERDRVWRLERDQAAAALAPTWRAHLDQVVPSLAVVIAVAERDAAIAAAAARLDAAVRAARGRPDPVTWELIGRAVGITRAGACNRWGPHHRRPVERPAAAESRER